MAWSKPFDDMEIAYVEKSYPRMSCRDIAAKLGRSQRGVEKLVARLGLSGEPRAPARAEPDAAQCGQDDLGELAELRAHKRLLKRMMREEAGPASMAKLSAEFRETVKRITELEREEDGEPGTSGVELGSLLVSVPLQPS